MALVISYFVNCCSDPCETYYFLKEYDKVFQMDINKCFNGFRFLADVNTNLQKSTILGNLRTATQEMEKETRQMTPSFPSTFCHMEL